MSQVTQPLSSRLDEIDRGAESAKAKFYEQAADEARRLAERFRRLEAVRAEVRELFTPRYEALSGRIPNAKPLIDSSPDRGEVRLIMGHTEECPPYVTLTMTVSHDGRAERLILDYTLSIVPVFMEFNPHSRFESPIEPFDREGAARWIEDRLVEFLQTYRAIPMVEAYQKDRMVFDPVARLWFGKGLAKATREAGGATHYFASEESASEFDRDPARFTATGVTR